MGFTGPHLIGVRVSFKMCFGIYWQALFLCFKQVISHLFCSNSFSWRSWPSSERMLLSALLRELIWLRRSCSTCLLACRSAFNFFMSCSSLPDREEGNKQDGFTPIGWIRPQQESYRTNASGLLSWLLGIQFSIRSLWGARFFPAHFCFFSLLLDEEDGTLPLVELWLWGEEFL